MRLLKLLEKYDIHVKNFCETIKPSCPYDSVYLMKNGKILVNLNINQVEIWVGHLDRNVCSILAALKSEGVNPQDKDAALKSISETCMPKRLSEVYLNFIYKGDK